MEHAPPGQGRDVGRHGPGNDQQNTVDRLAADRAVQGQGQEQPIATWKATLTTVQTSVLSEHAVRICPSLRHLGVILQADDPPVLKMVSDMLEKREQHVVEKRKHDGQKNYADQRRQHKQVGDRLPAQVGQQGGQAVALPEQEPASHQASPANCHGQSGPARLPSCGACRSMPRTASRCMPRAASPRRPLPPSSDW